MARIGSAMVKRLNAQVGMELEASQQYLAMAIWLEGRSMDALAEFYYRQSEEERGHALKIIRYMSEVDVTPVVPPLGKPKASFNSPKQIVDLSLEHERKVTDSIHELVDAASKAKDHATFHFLQWFVEEQIEEEATFSKLHDVLAMAQTVLQVEHYIRDVKSPAS